MSEESKSKHWRTAYESLKSRFEPLKKHSEELRKNAERARVESRAAIRELDFFKDRARRIVPEKFEEIFKTVECPADYITTQRQKVIDVCRDAGMLREKIQSLEQEVARLKEENQNLLNFRILDNERLSKKVLSLEDENKRLKEENLKMRSWKNCKHDINSFCISSEEEIAKPCPCDKWEIRK